MSSSPNGRHGGPQDPTRRLRYDFSRIMEQARAGGLRAGLPGAAALPERGTSGRRFVILAGITVLIVWGALYAVFREWRARYRERAAFGATQVAPTIDAFADVAPPGVDAARWRDAVARTHDMLVTVTASNLLGLDEMRDLRGELRRAAARAREHPEAAVAGLAAVWDDMSERGEFLMRDTRALKADRHPRPGLLPSYGEDRVAPALDPLAEVAPPRVDAARWRDAIARTRALLLDVANDPRMSTMRMMALRKELDRSAARARAHPESAVVELAAVWDALARAGRSLFLDPKAVLGGHPRPEIFPPE